MTNKKARVILSNIYLLWLPTQAGPEQKGLQLEEGYGRCSVSAETFWWCNCHSHVPARLLGHSRGYVTANVPISAKWCQLMLPFGDMAAQSIKSVFVLLALAALKDVWKPVWMWVAENKHAVSGCIRFLCEAASLALLQLEVFLMGFLFIRRFAFENKLHSYLTYREWAK